MIAAHPTEATLSDYINGLAAETVIDAVKRHLDDCPDCQRRVSELSTDEFGRRLRDSQKRVVTIPIGDGPSGSAVALPADGLPPGFASLPHYIDVRELGRGGMGVTYLARNTLTGRQEVLKVMADRGQAAASDRFQREIRAVCGLQHPNVVTAYTVHRLGDALALAMEYVPGDDLGKVLKARGPLPVANACYYVYQAALGLQHAHDRGLIHRDIKPQNLILAKIGNKSVVKVLDFGLAKATGTAGTADADLTGDGRFMGTPAYTAPEQACDAAKADIRADVYSLGCTLYCLLAGGPPFNHGDIGAVIRAHLLEEPTPLNQLREAVPEALAAVVAKMTAKRPEDRHQTPGEVARELLRFFKAGPAPVPQTPTAETKGSAPSTKSQTVRPPATESPPAQPETSTRPMAATTEEAVVVVQPPRATRRRGGPTLFAAVGLALFGLAGVWAAGVIKVRTPNGTLVIQGVPDGAEVQVDGQTVQISHNGEAMTLTVSQGKHALKVLKGGVELKLEGGAEVMIGGEPVRVRVEPPKLSPPPAPASGPAVPPAPSADRKAIEVIGLHWAVEGEQLVYRPSPTNGAPEYYFVYFGRPDWTDYTLSYEARADEVGRFSAVVRAAGHSRGYQFYPSYLGKQTMLLYSRGKFPGWQPGDGQWRPFGTKQRTTVTPGEWHRVVVKVAGDRVEGSLDGLTGVAGICTDFPRGWVGVQAAGGGVVRFRNFRVVAPNDTVLWEGLPDLPEVKFRRPAGKDDTPPEGAVR